MKSNYRSLSLIRQGCTCRDLCFSCRRGIFAWPTKTKTKSPPCKMVNVAAAKNPMAILQINPKIKGFHVEQNSYKPPPAFQYFDPTLTNSFSLLKKKMKIKATVSLLLLSTFHVAVSLYDGMFPNLPLLIFVYLDLE